MIFEKYKPLILGLWALFSFSVYSGNIYAKQTENTTVPQPVQNATVKGVVKDATGEPLIGVSVVVKGTTNGAVTDVNGNFSIACSANDILVFSYIGYDKIEVKAGNASFYNPQNEKNVFPKRKRKVRSGKDQNESVQFPDTRTKIKQRLNALQMVFKRCFI